MIRPQRIDGDQDNVKSVSRCVGRFAAMYRHKKRGKINNQTLHDTPHLKA
jgi:hypothetical protein